MYLRSLIMIALITALFACPFTNAFVSEYFANNSIGEFGESKKENTVIDEGTFVAAYCGPENAYGDDIQDLSDHDVAFNTAKSSSAEMNDNADDIVTGEESGIPFTSQGKNDTSKRYDANTTVSDNGINGTKDDKSYAAGANNYDSNIVENTNNKKESDNNASSLAGNSTAGTDTNKTSATPSQPADNKTSTAPSQPTGSNTSATSSQPAGNNASATSSQPVDNVNTGENSSGNSGSATSGGTEYGDTYRHNTSVYEDNSLIRVEYYDDDNNLYEYSDVTNYSVDTGSYTETVYRFDYENNVEVPVREDTYVNGVLVSSEYF